MHVLRRVQHELRVRSSLIILTDLTPFLFWNNLSHNRIGAWVCTWCLMNDFLLCLSPSVHRPHPIQTNVYIRHGFSAVWADDLLAQKEKNKLLQEEMESTLQDIQNM